MLEPNKVRHGNCMELLPKVDISHHVYEQSILDQIAKLTTDWNGNGAERFSVRLIEKVSNILKILSKTPDVFPTARNSIQLEYEKENGDYLEIEVFENQVKFFRIIGKVENVWFLDGDLFEIDKVVENFCF